MAIDLADLEAGTPYPGDYEVDLAALQKRLAHAQAALIAHGARAVILLEGWDAGGKGGAIQRLTAKWDPHHFRVHGIGPPTSEELGHHFLWRFWSRLPGRGEIAVFDRSWYGRVLVERVEALIAPRQWRRAYDEINEFEAQQKDDGTLIVKLFLHVSQAEQDARFRARLEHPWKRWKIKTADFHNRDRRAAYLEAMAEMFERTDTRWGPWRAIDGNDKHAARVAVLTHVAERLEAHLPMKPPELDEEIITLARAHLGEALAD